MKIIFYYFKQPKTINVINYFKKYSLANLKKMLCIIFTSLLLFRYYEKKVDPSNVKWN